MPRAVEDSRSDIPYSTNDTTNISPTRAPLHQTPELDAYAAAATAGMACGTAYAGMACGMACGTACGTA